MLPNIRLRFIFIFFFVALINATSSVFSQEIDYDDLYAKLPSLNLNQAYFKLFEYQKQNPFFANTYIQLGRVCELRMLEIDPLRDFEQTNYWAQNAVLFYNLFTVYAKEGDVRRNREFYANLVTPADGKKIEQEDVMAFLRIRLAFCKSYCDTVALAYHILAKSKEYYNRSVQIFTDINNSFSNLNEALLRTDEGFLKLLDSLSIQFNSSVDSFKAYQNIISRFPVGRYNQQFTPKPIETFRLDGITNSDFLDDNFTVWDYDRWIKDYRKVYSNDIIPLRKEISDIQELFMSNKRKLSLLDTVSRDDKFKSFDDYFLFRLGKYDNSSLVRELFVYLESNQNLLVSSKLALNNPNDTSSSLMNRKLRYYNRLALEHKKAMNSLDLFKNSIDSDRVANHKAFFDKYYNGISGLEAFSNAESLAMKKLMGENFEKFKRYLQNERMLKMSYGYTKGRQKIPQAPNYSLVGNATNEPFIVYSVSYAQEKPAFVGGYMNKPSRKPSAFVAKVDENSNAEWVKEIGNSPSLEQGDCARFIFGFTNGCLALVSGKEGDASRNSLVRLDAKGGIMFKKPVDETSTPCFLQFDEITQNSLLGFGQPTSEAISVFYPISLSLVDSVGTAVWKSEIPVKGFLVDAVKADDKFLAFINYQNYQADGKLISAGNEPESWGHLMALVNPNDGSIEKIIPLKSSASYTISKVFSISSSEISLIGQTTPSQLNPDGQMRYIVVNSKGEVQYSNL